MKKISLVLLAAFFVVALNTTIFAANSYPSVTILVDSVVTATDTTVIAYFGYTNSSTDTIYVPNSSNEFMIYNILDLNQAFIDLQYFYPGTHHTLYGPEFPATSGQVMWATFAKDQIISVTLGTDSITIDSSGIISYVPVEMNSFTAVLNGSNALLKWSTATEKNNYGFHIERSFEGSGTWVEVAFVNGAGTSNAPKYYSYEDKNLAPGAYVYRIKQQDIDGKMTIYNANDLPKVDAGRSDGLKLGGNYPNPFNPSTNLQFSVPVTGHASLKVYNVIGQEVAVLFSGTAQAGHYITATFNASRLASGIYFARLQYNGQSLVQRMLLTK